MSRFPLLAPVRPATALAVRVLTACDAATAVSSLGKPDSTAEEVRRQKQAVDDAALECGPLVSRGKAQPTPAPRGPAPGGIE